MKPILRREALRTSLRNALIQLRAFPVRSAIAILSVAAGVSGIVAVLSLSESLQNAVGHTLESDARSIVVVRFEPSYDDFAISAVKGLGEQELRSLAAVFPDNAVLPLVRFSGFDHPVALRDRSTFGAIYGAGSEFLALDQFVLIAGELPSMTDWRNRGRECLLGRTVAMELGGVSETLGQTISAAGRSCRVVGVVQGGGAALGFDFERLVLVSRRFVELLDPNGSLSDMEIYLAFAPDSDVAVAAGTIEETLRRTRRLPAGREDFLVVTAEGIRRYLDDTLSSIRFGLYSLIAVVLAVAAIGVGNVMLSGVYLRRSEIAIKRAVGATRRDVFVDFMAETMLLTAFGGICGLALGIGFTYAIATSTGYFGAPVVSFAGCTIAATVAILTGFLTGVLPAIRASRMDPNPGLHSH